MKVVMKSVRKLFFLLLKKLGVSSFFTDELFIKLQYYAIMGKRLNLENAIDFNEKVQWLKLYYRNPLMVTCADKWAVREFVKERIGEKYLAECIGVYDDVEKIPFAELPNQFVLKATHG